MKHDKGKTDNNDLRRGIEDEGPDAEGCARRSIIAQRLLEECESGLSRRFQERTGWEAVISLQKHVLFVIVYILAHNQQCMLNVSKAALFYFFKIRLDRDSIK